MKGDSAFERVRMSADEVLAAIRGDHQWQSTNDPEADASAMLTMDTTVREWRRVCDLRPRRQLGAALNRRFGTSVSASQWQDTLTPEETRTLQDVASLLASGATRMIPKRTTVLGCASLVTGVFFALRASLADARVAVDSVRPSSEIGGVVGTNIDALFLALDRVRASERPAVTYRRPGWVLNLALVGSLLVGSLLAANFGIPWLTLVLILSLGGVSIWIYVVPPPVDITVGQATTIGGLARELSGGFEADRRPARYR